MWGLTERMLSFWRHGLKDTTDGTMKLAKLVTSFMKSPLVPLFNGIILLLFFYLWICICGFSQQCWNRNWLLRSKALLLLAKFNTSISTTCCVAICRQNLKNKQTICHVGCRGLMDRASASYPHVKKLTFWLDRRHT